MPDKRWLREKKDGQAASAGYNTRDYLLILVVFTLISPVLVFAGMELAARAWQYRRFGPKSLNPLTLRDQFTGYRLNPAYARVDRQHNAQGFRRNRDVSLAKPANTIRIFITGGSAAYGWNTNMFEYNNKRLRFLYNDQTIDSYLEQRLNQASPSKNWEVINAAVPGYQLNQELAETESILLAYRPDCVILMDGANDMDYLWMYAREHYDSYSTVYHSEDFNLLANPGSLRSLSFFLGEWIRANSTAFRLVQDRLALIQEQHIRTEREKKYDGVRNPISLADLTPAEQARLATAESQLGFYTHTVRLIHSILNADGVKALFLLQPTVVLTQKQLTDSEQKILAYQLAFPGRTYALQQLLPKIGAAMTAAAQHDGFTFLNLTSSFDKTSEQTFSDDVHLTPEGNRIIAERLFPVLKDIFAEN
jgi:lysophospholipase L1-like esterase